MFTQAADGGSPPQPLGVRGSDVILAGWEPSGSSILFARGSASRGLRIESRIVRLTLDGKTDLLATDPGAITKIVLAPDGRFLAYEVDQGDGYQISIFVVATGERVAVTSAGGRRPSWSRDGRKLCYVRNGSIFAVLIRPQGDGAPQVGQETRLFDWPDAYVWVAGPDGAFDGTEPVPGAARQTSLQIRTGWLTDVVRLAATTKR